MACLDGQTTVVAHTVRRLLALVLICLDLVLISAGWASAQQGQSDRKDAEGIIDTWTPGTGIFNESASPTTSVDPVSGVAHSTIPIALPQARGAAQPVLNLVYSSNAGTRTAGVGWGLDIPAIELKPLLPPGAYFNPAVAGELKNPQKHPNILTSARYTFGGRPIIALCVVGNEMCTAMPNETMPAWAEGWTYFRAQLEGTFSRIFRSPNNGDTWVVEQKNGVTMEFGKPITEPDAGQGSVEGNISPPVPCVSCEVPIPWRWNLVRQYDTQRAGSAGALGKPVNLIVYQWSEAVGVGFHYLTDVYDTPAAGSDLGKVDNYAHHTSLAYEESPDIPDLVHAQLWRAAPDRRLLRIDVASKGWSTGSAPRDAVRRYLLQYRSMLHGSYLTSVQLEGRCPTATEINGRLPDQTNCPTMPPITFTYSEHIGPPSTAIITIPITGAPDPARAFPSLPNVAVVDIDRNGLPDIVQAFTAVPTTSVQGSKADANDIYFNRTLGLSGAMEHAQIDASEVAWRTPGQPNRFLSSQVGTSVLGYWGNLTRSGVVWRWTDDNRPDATPWYASSYIELAPSAPNPLGQSVGIWTAGKEFQTGNLYFASDIDGDGLVDGITLYYDRRFVPPTRQSVVLFTARDLASPDNFVLPFSIAARTGGVDLTDTQYADWALRTLADMNGDGVPDFVVGGGDNGDQYFYLPGDGTGSFGCIRPKPLCSALHWPQSGDNALSNGKAIFLATPKAANNPWEALPKQKDLADAGAHIWVHDINGDGLADIIVADKSGSTLSIWLNDDGINFHRIPDIDLKTIPNRGPTAKVTFADMNASGTDDIVIIYPTGVSYIDLTPVGMNAGGHQGLLVSIANGLGATTTIQYKSTAYLDEAARRAGQPWVNHSPKVEFVVTRVTMSADLANYSDRRTDSYSYRDAIYDDWQQTFLGFRKVIREREGDLIAPNTIIETTYFFGHCQGEHDTNCVETSDDDNWKAVTAAPIVSEIYDALGKHYSTTVWRYRASVLANGARGDGRRVQFGYPEATDTWLYDPEAPPSAQTVTVPVVAHQDDSIATDTAIVSLFSSLGRVHLRSEQAMDSSGNVVGTIDHGQINDGGNPIDLPVITEIHQVRPTSSWLWRVSDITVRSFSHQAGVPDATPRSVAFTYDATGDLTDVHAALSGVEALDRFHENSTKGVARRPPNASADNPNLWLAHLTYDEYGNVTSARGPTKGGGCELVDYTKDDYRQWPTVSTVYTDGCDDNGLGRGLALQTVEAFDRGLGTITETVEANGGHTTRLYDAFARLSEIHAPDPDTGAAATAASIKLDYPLSQDGLTQLVHRQDITAAGKYSHSWTYLNGFGAAILALREADPAMGDGGHWVASGLPQRTSSGLIQAVYRPWFYDGQPDGYPIGPPSNPPMYTFSYDGTRSRDGFSAMEPGKSCGVFIMPCLRISSMPSH